MTGADPLEGLRPLHLPPPVSWWPPAPGWWLVFLLIIMMIFIAALVYKRTKARRAALAELTLIEQMECAPEEFVQKINALLKRYALVCFPKEQVAALNGAAWQQFLAQHAGKHEAFFREGNGAVLGFASYAPGVETDRSLMLQQVRSWLKTNRKKEDLLRWREKS